VEAASAGSVWEAGSISVDSARPGTAEARKGTAAARTTTRIGEARFRTTAPGLVELGRRARTPSTTWTHARPSSLKQRRERQRLLPTQQRTVDGLNVVTPLRQRAAQRKGVERAVASRLGDEERSLVAPEKKPLPEHGGTPYGPGARLLAGAGTITAAQRVVRVVQQPAAAGAAKVLANAVHKAGGCLRVPHQARRTVCARRSHSRGARAAGERETGLSGAGPS
jgi:hypothetical protein